jgi:hypothetical protein
LIVYESSGQHPAIFSAVEDAGEYLVGADLGPFTRLRLRNSKKLVIVARPVALTECGRGLRFFGAEPQTASIPAVRR